MGRFISRFFALCFVLLFVIVASFSACTASFRNTLIDIETYKQVLADQDVYDDIIPYVIPTILRDSENSRETSSQFAIDFNDMESFMSEDDWRAVSAELLPAEWLQSQTEAVLDTINNISQGNLEQTSNLIDVTEIIARLQGDEADNASRIIIESAPDCTVQQVVQLRQFDGNAGETFPICNPPTTLTRSRSIDTINMWFFQIGEALRSQIESDNVNLVIPEDYTRLIYNLFQLDSQLSLLLLLCPLSLIGFIIVFAVRNLKGFGRWLGGTFVLTGILTICLIFMSQIPVFESFDEVVRANSDAERFEAQIYAGFMRSIYADASETMILIAGAMIGVGFLLFVVSFLSRSHNLIVPEGAMLVTSDGRIISNATQPGVKTTILPDED